MISDLKDFFWQGNVDGTIDRLQKQRKHEALHGERTHRLRLIPTPTYILPLR